MGFYEHADEFAGKQVADYHPGEPLSNPQTTAYRLAVDYEDYETEATVVDMLQSLLEDPAADRVTALVIGIWVNVEELVDSSPAEVVETLVSSASQLSSLTGLFLGDITQEENEVSWIQQCDLSPLWKAFPKLEHLKVRGSQGLSLGKINHAHLKSLTIECGGLPKSVLQEIIAAKLPALEHLELYLGDSGYGWDGSIEDLQPLLQAGRFPKLKYLGLCDSEIADEVAKAVVKSPVLEQLEVLDLSRGTLGDEGGRALLECPAIRKLKKLDLHHHYLSNDLLEQFSQLPLEVDVDGQEDEGDYGRYVEVGE